MILKQRGIRIVEDGEDWNGLEIMILKSLGSLFLSKYTNDEISPLIFNVYFRDDIRKIMMSKYLSNPDYNFEKVNRASLACGPLVKWSVAQVQ